MANQTKQTSPRVLSVEDLMDQMARATTPEEIKRLDRLADNADQMRADYGFSDADTLRSGHVPPEDIHEQLNTLPSEAAAQTVTGGQLPEVEKGAMQVNTLQVLGTGHMRKAPELSGPRWCAAGFYRERTGRDVRPVRLRITLPPRGEGGVPAPILKERLQNGQEIYLPIIEGMDTGEELETTQRKLLLNLMVVFARHGQEQSPADRLADAREMLAGNQPDHPMDELDRVPVKAEPELGNNWVVTLMDAREVVRFTDNAGDWHYLGGLLSDGGSVPGTNDPDYYRLPYQAMSCKQAGPLYELLGLGPAYDFEADEPIIDGQSIEIWPDWPTNRGYPVHRALDAQIRAVTGYGPDQRPTYTKGMKRPVKPSVAREALDWYDQLPADDDRRQYYQGAAKTLRTALQRNEPTLVLIKGDQVKIGHEHMATSGMALVAQTYLRGTLEAHPDGRNRAPFRIIGNPQLTQFLSEDGFERLESHMEAECERIASMCKSLPGIARLAGDTTAHKREELAAGEGTYETAKDLLTDGILGGGVRLYNSDDWIAALQAEKSGQMAALPSIKTRLDQTSAAYVRRRLLRGQGIYGYAGFNMTCADDIYLMEHANALYEPAGEEYVRAREQRAQGDGPLLDPSGFAIPRKIAALLGADDDGDIVTGLAAKIDVPVRNEDGERIGTRQVKGVMIWRFPCVDVPVFMALPTDMRTPWDARSDEEDERFRRILNIYGLALREDEEPAVKDAEPTLLTAEDATRLADEGARDALDAQSIDLPATESNGWQMVQRKRKLNMTGTLTRDLERLGELIAVLKAKRDEYDPQGDMSEQAQYRAWQRELDHILDEAGTCSLSIEIQLIQHKKRLNVDAQQPNLVVEPLGHPYSTSNRYIRQHHWPIDYPGQLDQIRSLLSENKSKGETICLEEWDGPDGQTRHARLLRRIVQGPMQKIINEFKNISTDRQPFLRALEKQVRDARKRAKAEGRLDAFNEQLEQERHGVRQICQWFRRTWSEVLDEVQEMKEEADDPEAAAEDAQERTSRVGRAMSRAMKIFGRAFSAEGLAYGLYWDWKDRRRGEENEWSRSTKAGLQMITGRIGDVLLPPEMDVQSIQPNERSAVVFTRQEAGPLPMEKVGETWTLQAVRVHTDGQGETTLLVRYENGEEQQLHLDSQTDAPPEEIAGAVAHGNVQARVSKIARSRGVFRFLSSTD